MAIDAYIKFEGSKNTITGESLDSQLKGGPAGWSSLQSVTFSTKNISNIGTAGGGGGAGKVDFEDFSITKQVDSASPFFFLALCSGDHYDTVTIAIRKAGGGEAATPVPYLQYKFAMVYVTSIGTSASGGDEAPTETVTFAYGATEISYAPQDAKGNIGKANPKQWSRVLNKATLAVS